MSHIKKSLKLFISVLVYSITGLIIGGFGSLTYATMDIFDQYHTEAGIAVIVIVPLFGLIGAGLGMYIGYEKVLAKSGKKKLKLPLSRDELRLRAISLLKEKFLLALSIFVTLMVSVLSVFIIFYS